jgi:hypothetical protein
MEGVREESKTKFCEKQKIKPGDNLNFMGDPPIFCLEKLSL